MPNLPGAERYLKESEAIPIDSEEMNDEHDEEIDAYMAGLNLDERLRLAAAAGDSHYLRPAPTANKRQKYDASKLDDHLKQASENVIVTGTKQEYERYVPSIIAFGLMVMMLNCYPIIRLWQQFCDFCTEVNYVNKPTDIDEMAAKRDLPEAFPRWIAVWIMNKYVLEALASYK